MQREIKLKEEEDRDKHLKIQRDKEIKMKNIQKKNQEMAEMREVIKKKKMFGYTSTILFLAFFLMHIWLAQSQYDIGKMNRFNHGIGSSLLPGIDVDKQLVSKAFLNVSEVNMFFLNDVNERF